MSKSREVLEQNFEEQLIEVLALDYDLNVRRTDDKLDRRRHQVATLLFDYRYAKGSPKGKALVNIEGVEEFTNMLPIDFSSTESLQRSAENCEALALYLMEHLQERCEQVMSGLEESLTYCRREDDWI